MKKVIFSAIAMIAFVGSSMANTSEIIEVKVSTVNEIVLEKELVAYPFIWLTRCDVIYIKTLALAKEQDFSSEDAVSIAYGAFKACDEAEQK